MAIELEYKSNERQALIWGGVVVIIALCVAVTIYLVNCKCH